MRKQKQLQDLTDEMGRLEVANNGVEGKIAEITEKYMVFAAENNVLRAQLMELTERLRSLNDVIKNLEMVGDATHLPDPLLKPWQTSWSVQPIPASSGIFQL